MFVLPVAVIVGSVVYSEREHIAEKQLKPISLTENNILPHEIFEGPTKDSPCLFFLHGWPDDLAMFRFYARELSKTYRCVNCTLPGYPTPPVFSGNNGTIPERKWGYTFDETIVALKATIEATCPNQPVTLVLHDWGCLIGYMLCEEYKNLKIQRMITMDVGTRLGGMTLVFSLFCIVYQGLLNLLWLLPAFVGNFLTWALSTKAMQRVVSSEDLSGPALSCKNWPYRASFRELLQPNGRLKRALFYYKPVVGVPFLFLHNQEIPAFVSFFDDEFKAAVASTAPTSKCVVMEGMHWFMVSNAEKLMPILKEWLKETDF